MYVIFNVFCAILYEKACQFLGLPTWKSGNMARWFRFMGSLIVVVSHPSHPLCGG